MEYKKHTDTQKTKWVDRHKKTIIIAFLGVCLGIGILYKFTAVEEQKVSDSLPGRAIPDLGHDMIGRNSKHDYNSNPPTNGWYYVPFAEGGAYPVDLPDEMLVHNLARGDIWISYKPGISDAIRKKLESFSVQYGKRVVVTPRPQNDTDIAVAGWARLDTFNVADYSDERVDGFIKAFINKGPEAKR